MEENIIRGYPKFKEETVFTSRYDKKEFEKYNEIIKSDEKMINYNKWKIGINFITKRKIKIGGKTHYDLGYKHFSIHSNRGGYYLFTNLDGINSELYIQETEKIKKEIIDYNLKISNIISKIESLNKWEDYIKFEGLKYGISSVHGQIHRENNCFGLIKLYDSEGCTCHSCEDWGGCSNPVGTNYYKCEKCDYKYKTSKSDSTSTWWI